jgi:hypothetical protein
MRLDEQPQLSADPVSPRSHEPLRKSPAKIVLAAAIVFVLTYWSGTFVSLTPGILAGVSDFSGFYAAGKMVLTGHASKVYDYQAEVEAQRPFVVEGRSPVLPFVFAPYSLFLFTLLARLSYPHAVVTWFAINILILLTIPFLLRRRLKVTDERLALALIGMAFFYPLNLSLAQGQLTPLTLLLFTLVFLNLCDRHDFTAGCILAVALLKPQFVVPLLVVFVCTRNWRALRGFCWSCLVLFGLSLLLVGWKSTVGYPAAMIQSATLPASIGEPAAQDMTNVRGLLQWLLDSHLPRKSISLIAAAASVMLLIGLAAVMATQQAVSELGFALVMTITVLGSYHCYKHDMGLLILALFFVAHHLTLHNATKLRLALGMCGGLMLLAPSILSPHASVVLQILFSAVLVTEMYDRTERKAQTQLNPALNSSRSTEVHSNATSPAERTRRGSRSSGPGLTVINPMQLDAGEC